LMRLLSLLLTFAICLTPMCASAVQVPGVTVAYNLYATDGYYELPDGQPLHFYGLIGGREGIDFTYQSSCMPGRRNQVLDISTCTGSTNVTVSGGPVAPQGGPWAGQDAQFVGNAQFPAPIFYASVGDVVEVRLKNLGVVSPTAAGSAPHSIRFHALDLDAGRTGVPETTWDAVPANLCSDGTTAGPQGCGAVGPAHDAGTVEVYMFTPSHAGTYLYYCQYDPDGGMPTALFGAMVVYNPGDAAATVGPGQGLGGTLYGVKYDQDRLLLLSDFQVDGRGSLEGTQESGPDDAQYWFINGLSFPQTIHAAFPSGYSFAQWLTAHPGYDPLITGSVSAVDAGSGRRGQQVLIRAINTSLETQPMHMDGIRGEIIGSDQRGWFWAGNVPSSQSREEDTLAIGSGETYDWLVDFGQQVSNSPAATPAPLNSVTGSEPPEAGSFYFPMYNLDDYKTTSTGISPGGMFTFLVSQP
jgi:FtsP/CotA-like multicopper oxidase with cupredoxin domain